MNSEQKLKETLIDTLKNFIKEEEKGIVSIKPQFLIDDDDDYQDALETSWHNDEIRDKIRQYQKAIDSDDIFVMMNLLMSIGYKFIIKRNFNH